MIKVWLLYLVVLFRLVFVFLPETVEPKGYFPFSDMKLYFASHVYYIWERYAWMTFSYIVASEVRTKRPVFAVYFLLCIGDLIDYLLCYNEIWFTYGMPVSYNVFTCVSLGCAILYFRNHE